jgi:hypothetical protein
MLTIEKKNTPLNWLIVVIVSAAVAVITTFAVSIMLSAWTAHLCGNVPLSDYTQGRAPSKCQELWFGGRI